jgi:hypothetical protein
MREVNNAAVEVACLRSGISLSDRDAEIEHDE